MASSENIVSIHDALKQMRAHWPDLGVESLALKDCFNRILAARLVAKVSLPPLDASAMDGYAVKFSDVGALGRKLRVLGEVPAGSQNPYTIQSGETVRVFTGSPMPAGADHVLVQEHADIEGNIATVIAAQKEARHIRKAGRDFQQGDVVLSKGLRLGASHLGLAAGANHAKLSVNKRPRIAILTTGSELRAPGSVLSAGQIVESNSYSLTALLESLGAEVSHLDLVADNEMRIEDSVRSVGDADIILTVGGASVGKYDLVRSAFVKLGGQFIFERIAVRPGKPTWFGLLQDQRVIGLPGNPTAAYVMASLLLQPLLLGKSSVSYLEALLGAPLNANGPRETFTRAHMKLEHGVVRVCPLKDQDTSRVHALASANCLIHRPEHDPEKSQDALTQIVLLD